MFLGVSGENTLDCKCSPRVRGKMEGSTVQIPCPNLEAPRDSADLNFLLGWLPFRYSVGCGLNCPVVDFLHVLYDIRLFVIRSFLSLLTITYILMWVSEGRMEEKTCGWSITFIGSFYDIFLRRLSFLVFMPLWSCYFERPYFQNSGFPHGSVVMSLPAV